MILLWSGIDNHPDELLLADLLNIELSPCLMQNIIALRQCKPRNILCESVMAAFDDLSILNYTLLYVELLDYCIDFVVLESQLLTNQESPQLLFELPHKVHPPLFKEIHEYLFSWNPTESFFQIGVQLIESMKNWDWARTYPLQQHWLFLDNTDRQGVSLADSLIKE